MSSRIAQVNKERRGAARYLKRGFFSLLLAALLFILTVGGRSQKRGSDLESLFQIGLPRADIAILLDASLSMRNHRYSDVRQAVIDFTSNLTSDETLSLRIFGDITSSPLEGRADKIAGNVAEYLPAQPLFQYTDLGLVILKSLEFLERGEASEAQALLLITDGRHDPPPGSSFGRDFRHDANWQSLRRRAHEICRTRRVLVFGFSLGDLTDVSVMSEVFPTTNVELIVGDAGQVISTLARVREKLRTERLRIAVEREMKEGRVMVQPGRSSIEIEGRDFTEAVTIRNGYRHLPVVIDRIHLDIDAGSSREIELKLDAPPAAGLELAPGQEWKGKIGGLLYAELPSLVVGSRVRNYGARLRVLTVGRFKHRDDISKLGLGESRPVFSGQPMRIAVRARYGLPYWIIACALLAGSGLALMIARRRRLSAVRAAAYEKRISERKRITGEVEFWPVDQPESDHGGIDLADLNREKLWVTTTTGSLPEIVATADREDVIVAFLDSRISGARPGDAESGRVEFSIEAAPSHSLAYESDGRFRAAARLTLCDRDLIVIDDRWNLRYSNHRLRTRAEAESAQGAKTEPRATTEPRA